MEERTYPLAQPQLSIYAECIAHEGKIIYTIPCLMEFKERLDAERLAHAVEQALSVHDVIFARIFIDDDGEPRMRPEPRPHRVSVPVERMTEARFRQLKPELSQPYNLLGDRLFRACVYETEEHLYLFFDFHHIIFDGSSINIFIEEIGAAYEGRQLEFEAVTGFDVAAKDAEDRKSPAYDDARQWFVNEFQGCETSSLPAPDHTGAKGDCGHIDVPIGISHDVISRFCKQVGTSWGGFVCGVLGRLLAVYAGKDEAVLSTYYTGRTSEATARTVMMMVRTLPVRCRITPDMTVAQYLAGMKRQINGARQHDVFSFADAAAQFGIEGGIICGYQGNIFDIVPVAGADYTMEHLEDRETSEKMSIQIVDADQGPLVRVEYSAENYSPEFMQRFMQSYVALMRNMIADPDALVCKTSIMSEEQRREVEPLHCVASGDIPIKTFHGGIEEQARLHPDTVAVIACDRTYTYGELDEAANRMAHELVSRGVERGDRVVLLLPRTSDFFVMLLAVMKCGAAYIPMDPAYPVERITYILNDSDGRFVVTTTDHVADYGERGLDIEQLRRESASQPATPVGVEVDPHDLAYLIYTSGSTGNPKGVMLEHLGVANALYVNDASITVCSLAHWSSVTLCQTTVSFDLSISEYGAPLFNGKTVVFASEEQNMNALLLADLCRRTGVECISGTPSRLATNLEIEEFHDVFKNQIKAVMMGGEKLPWSLVERLRDMNIKVVNGYGPTETTMGSSGAVLNDANYVHIGKPLYNYTYTIVDRNLNEVPVGVVGELAIGGPGVARGYNKLPEKTAKAFINLNGARTYLSGDYARWDSDGNVVILGRTDSQIKLNGLRIELGEIETVMARQPGVKQCVVVIKKNGTADVLVAYYVADGDCTEEGIRAGMGEKLTPYMVPSVFVKLDKMPITPAGKIDVKNLPDPEFNELAQAEEAPRELNLLEERIASIVSTALECDNVLVTLPLASQGLTSLKAMRLAALLYKGFNIKMQIKDLVGGATVFSIENIILKAMLDTPETSETPATTDATKPLKSHYPLSFTQRGVYVDCLKNTGTTIYNIPMLVGFPASVTPQALQQAVKQTLENHKILFTNFRTDVDDTIQTMPESIEANVALKTLAPDEFENEKANFVQPFDLERDRLFRAQVVECEGKPWLFLDIHHLLCDGASCNIIIQEIANRLSGKSVPAESCDYFRFVDRQQQFESGAEFDDYTRFFAGVLGDFEENASIAPDISTNRAGVSKTVACPLTDKCRPQAFTGDGVTDAHFWFSATAYALARYTNMNDVFIATVSSGRQNLDITDTVGMFVNTLPVAAHLKEQSVKEFVNANSRMFANVIEHENYPYSRIATDYGYNAEINFAYQLGVLNTIEVNGEPVAIGGMTLDTPKFNITISLDIYDGKPSVVVEYNDAMYSNRLMQSLADSIVAVAQAFSATPGAPLLKTSIMNDDQRREVEAFHSVATGEVPIKTFHGGIEEQARLHPDDVAIVACDRTLTYRQFDEAANQMAHTLIDNGLQHGDRVVLLMPRTSDFLVMLLAVMKCGAAYIPMDPAYPVERITYILDDSEGRFVVTTPDRVADYGERGLDIEQLCRNSASQPATPVDIEVDPHDLAYLIYTSGSTGKPKGVMLEHLNAANFFTGNEHNMIVNCYQQWSRVTLCQATISFDLSIIEYGSPLFYGNTVVFANEEQCQNALLLADLCKRNGVDCLSGTPARLAMNLEIEELAAVFRDQIKVVMVGGDKLPWSLVERLRDMDIKVVNGYGPTETTMGSSGAVLNDATYVHVGKPFYNYTYTIVDRDLNEVPVGVVGELAISGLGVSRGYNKLPDKTAKAFIGHNGVRTYLSGDYARWDSDGNVIILGRTDNQIKLNGLRIELGEIETVMARQPGVKQCVVLIKKVGNTDMLVAYYVADGDCTEDGIKAGMGEKLTPYMVPSVFVKLDKMPVTPAGKVDVKSLPEPQLAVQSEYVAPVGQVESDLCEAMAAVLKLEKVGATDNFFDIGGTSLIAMRLVVAAGKKGYNIVYKNLFENPTPRQLAAFIGGDAGQGVEQDSEVEDFDYSAVNRLLDGNTLEAFVGNSERQPLGSVLLTGATGYLGIHVLHQLLEDDSVPQVWCMVRGNKTVTAESRLHTLLFYYFDNVYEELWGSKLHIIEGDVTSPAAFDKAPALDVVINCAANVKHFSAGTDIEDVNYGGVVNCVDYCLKHGARFIQTSTYSIAGNTVGDTPVPARHITEQELYFGQDLSNKYCRSKFLAERYVLDAVVNKGLNAKVMRLGNLSARSTDGEFQINFRSNSAMNRLKAFKILECMPYSMQDVLMEFSPINEVAKAVLMLATTPRQCVVFHPANIHKQLLGDVVNSLAQMGYKIDLVEDKQYQNSLAEALNDADKADVLQSMMAYQENIDGKFVVNNQADFEFTAQVLYRMGFRWSITTWDYIEQFLNSLQGLDFFGENER